MKTKHRHLAAVTVFFYSLFYSVQLFSQSSFQLDSQLRENASFYEIRQFYNDYFDDQKVVDGFYYGDRERIKAPGWKLFKRWEWFWESRIDPKTGAFPETSAADIRAQIKGNSNPRNVNGNWQSLGPNTTPGGYAGLGRLNTIAFVPGDENRLYVGSPSGGLWKTTDGALNWDPMTDDNDVLGVSDIIVLSAPSPMDDTLYIATGDRDKGSMHALGGGQRHDNNSIGVLKSLDGGMTWNSTALSWLASDKNLVNRLLKHPTNSKTIYAATSEGIYLTTDGGATWPLISDVDEFIDMEFNPSDPDIMYGGTREGDIYTSYDGGSTWLKTLDITDGRRVELAVSPDESDWVYAVVSKPGGGLDGIYKSEDAGDSFTQIFDGTIYGNYLLGYNCLGTEDGGQGSYDLCMAVDPFDALIVYLGGINTWGSTDGGLSWEILNMWTAGSSSNSCGAPVVHADQHWLEFFTGTSILYECNDGGLYKTSNGGISWENLGSGLVIGQAYRMGVSQLSSTSIISGYQDVGTKSVLGGSWEDVIGGDGMECIIDYTDDNTQYGETQNGGLKRTKDGWNTSTKIGLGYGLSGSAFWVMPYAIDPTTHTTLYAALDTIWRTTSQGDSWSRISDFTTEGEQFRSLAIAPSNSDIIYAALKNKIYATFDGTAAMPAWTDITGSLPVDDAQITYISVKHDDANTLWVSMGAYNEYGVYESTDAGTTWTNISSGLPSIPVMCVIQNRQNTGEVELYAGTDVGVYVKVGTAVWALYSSELPNVVVSELEIYYDDASPNLSRIRAATYGRGIWESELYSPEGPPVADFSADDLNPLVDSTVNFTDLSINDPDTWLWSFTPATVNYQDGTNSGSQHPVVSFDTSGEYTVELTASNTNGSDTETKTNYISAIAPHFWEGEASSDWSAASNWDLGTVPNENDHVVITAGATHYPELEGSLFTVNSAEGNYRCKSLRINDGGIFTVGSQQSSSMDMDVYGKLTVFEGGILRVADDLYLESGGSLYLLGGTILNIIQGSTKGDIKFRSGSSTYMTGGSLTVNSELSFRSGSLFHATGGIVHCGGSGNNVVIYSSDSDLILNDFVVDAGGYAEIESNSSRKLPVGGNYTQETGSSMIIPAGTEISVAGDALIKENATLTINGTFTVGGDIDKK